MGKKSLSMQLVMLLLGMTLVIAIIASQSAVAAEPNVLSDVNLEVPSAEKSRATFYGNAMEGLTEKSMHDGKKALYIHLHDPSERFLSTLTKDRVLSVLKSSIQSETTLPVDGTQSKCWDSVEDEVFGPTASVEFNTKRIKMIFGKAPSYNCTSVEVISIMLPGTLLQKGHYGRTPANIEGPNFFVVPDGFLSFVEEEPFIAMKPAKLKLTDGDFSQLRAGYRIVDGTSCTGSRNAELAEGTMLDESEKTITFTPLKGGSISLCYSPYAPGKSARHDGGGSHPAPGLNGQLGQVKVNPSFVVAGAHGFDAEPRSPREDDAFTVDIYGSHLTLDDAALLTRDPCSTIPADQMGDTVQTLSENRVTLTLMALDAGENNLCYLRYGQPEWSNIGSIDIQMGADATITSDLDHYISRGETIVDLPERHHKHSAHVGRLVIESGNFKLGQYNLNVSQFTWVKGNILGRGTIICTNQAADRHTIDAALEDKVIESNIRNDGGVMEINIGKLIFADGGQIENSGTLIIQINGTVSNSALMRVSKHGDRRSKIVNRPGGTIRFVSELEDARLVSDVFIENHGKIEIQARVMVTLINTFSDTNSAIILGDESRLISNGAEWTGPVVTLSSKSEVKFEGGRQSIRGAQFGGLDGRVDFTEGTFDLDQLSFGGTVNVMIYGETASYVTLGGHTHFGPNTVLAIRDVHFTSAYQTAYLDVDGRFLCHVSSVHFGDNLVVGAHMESVLFGSGEVGTPAQLVPQHMPSNSSLFIPQNATLVIIDISGNRTRDTELAVAPRVCSSFVVVPMHVKVDGAVLLHGCAIMPFGGQQKGVVHSGSVEAIETIVQYAFCKNVLQGMDVCVPVFTWDTNNGLALGGSQTLALPPTHPTVDLPVVDLQYFEAMAGSELTNEDGLTLVASKGMVVDGALTVPKGGFIRSSVLTVNGVLSAKAQHPLTVDGELDVNGKLSLELDTDTCSFPLTVTDVMRFGSASSMACKRVLNVSAGASTALIEAGIVSGLPAIESASCAPDYLSATLLNGAVEDKDLRDGEGDTIGLQLKMKEEFPSREVKVGALGILFGIVLFYLFFWHYWQLSMKTVFKELSKRTDVPAHLSWAEFSNFANNFFVIISWWVDALMLAAPALHPSLPIPKLGFLTEGAHWLLDYTTTDHGRFYPAICLCLVILWGILWLPLVAKKFSTKLKEMLHGQEQTWQRYFVRYLFLVHVLASAVALVLFIPAMSLIMDIISCGTFLKAEPECIPFKSLFAPAVVAFLLFLYLASYAPSCKSFPFGHPPYRPQLDIRQKRVYTYTIYSLYALQIGIWKIFINSPLQMLVSSMIIQLFVLILTIVAAPCVYANINRMRIIMSGIPLWGIIVAMIQMWRLGADPAFLCDNGDPVFPALLFSGWVLVVASGLLAARRTGTAEDLLRDDPSSAVHLAAIKETHERLEEYRVELFNTGNNRDRDNISENIAALRIHQLKLLSVYRRKKERIALPYYLGDILGRRLLDDRALDEGSGTPTSDVPMKSFKSKSLTLPSPGSPKTPSNSPQVPLGGQDLTFEQMERFIQGPPLGRGSYGSVYMGMLPDGRLMAVKEVEISRKHKKEQLAQVKKEVNVLKNISHPNVIRYFGAIATGRVMRVFMEFAVGGSLTSLVRKFESLSEPMARQYTRQILQGLHYLHQQHVVHRDIKGENILIDGQGRAKLADFGCSKGLSDIANKSREGCASLVGSPYWMAPEVIRNEAYGTKADIWSVGCTVVEVLNGGNPPWHEKFDNVYTAMYFIGTTNELPSNIPENVTDECKDFLARCFERDVQLRASAADLLEHPWIKSLGDDGEGSSPAGTTTTGGDDDSQPLGARQWSDMFDTMDSNESRSMQSSQFNSEQNSLQSRQITEGMSMHSFGAPTRTAPSSNEGQISFRSSEEGGDQLGVASTFTNDESEPSTEPRHGRTNSSMDSKLTQGTEDEEMKPLVGDRNEH